MYDTALKKRYQFMFISPTIINRIEESYEQIVYSDVQYSEDVTIETLNNGWIERGEFFVEYCVMIKE